MPNIHLKCQGLPCPQPVLKCKNAIDEQCPATLSVIVDNEAAQINVSRFLTTQGYEVTFEKTDNEIIISGTRSDAECAACSVMNDEQVATMTTHKNLVFIASDIMGKGDNKLGQKLMYNFVATLKEMGTDLWRIILVNGAVNLAVTDHPCVKELQFLEKKGVSILVCGTCLEYFGLTSQKQVGEVTNMLDVVTSLQLATKTIRV